MKKKYLPLFLSIVLFYSATAQTVPAGETYLTVNKGTTTTTGTKTTGQTITPTSTAEECVRFIDNKVRTVVGQSIEKYYTITNVYFTGGKYIYQYDISPSVKDKYSSVSIYTYSNINWGCYKSLVLNDINNVSMKATLFFDASCLLNSQFRIFDYETNFPLVSTKAYQYDSLVLYFARSEKAALVDLDKAAKRLSQIVKEKGNIFQTTIFKPKLIEGKPGFKETVEFIDDNYLKEITCYGYTKEYNSRHDVEVTHKNISLTMIAGTDSLNISYYHNLKIPADGYNAEKTYYRNYSAIFSLKDIESLDAVVWTALNGFVNNQNAIEANFPSGIKFNAVNGKSLIRYFSMENGEKRVQNVSSVVLPFGSYSKKDNIDGVISNVKNSRVFKAINHLRNLCGAPEPLNF